MEAAEGEADGDGELSGRAGCPAGALAGPAAAGCPAGALAELTASPTEAAASAVSNVASSVPIGTVSPSLTLTSLRVPATGDGISVFTLSVWTSTSRSYF